MTTPTTAPAATVLGCPHTPPCPAADAVDHDAAVVVAAFPEQGWELRCNGVICFDDTGELVGTAPVAPHRPEPPHHKVTPRVLDLLGWVDDMEIWQEDDGRSVRTVREVFGLSDPVEQVTDEMADIKAAGWAVVREGTHGSRYWVLTDEGRRVAREHREDVRWTAVDAAGRALAADVGEAA